MKNYNLTLIFYEPNWVRTCRCCVVDQGDSSFSVEFPKDLEEAEKLIVKNDGCFALLVNGKRPEELPDEDIEFYDSASKLTYKYYKKNIQL